MDNNCELQTIELRMYFTDVFGKEMVFISMEVDKIASCERQNCERTSLTFLEKKGYLLRWGN